jgi:hypothetical protein
VRLFLPKFRLAPSAVDLKPPLRKLGVTGAFDEPRGSADLGRIAPRSGDEYLAIGSAVQRVFVDVAEEGTEAATVTGMNAEPFGGPANTPPPVVVRVTMKAQRQNAAIGTPRGVDDRGLGSEEHGPKPERNEAKELEHGECVGGR